MADETLSLKLCEMVSTESAPSPVYVYLSQGIFMPKGVLPGVPAGHYPL